MANKILVTVFVQWYAYDFDMHSNFVMSLQFLSLEINAKRISYGPHTCGLHSPSTHLRFLFSNPDFFNQCRRNTLSNLQRRIATGTDNAPYDSHLAVFAHVWCDPLQPMAPIFAFQLVESFYGSIGIFLTTMPCHWVLSATPTTNTTYLEEDDDQDDEWGAASATLQSPLELHWGVNF